MHPQARGTAMAVGDVGGRLAGSIGNFTATAKCQMQFCSQILVAFLVSVFTTGQWSHVAKSAVWPTSQSEQSRPQINRSNKHTASLLLCLPVCMHGLATTNSNNQYRTDFDKSNTGSAKKSNFTTLILE